MNEVLKENDELTPIQSTTPPAPWQGGKRSLASRLSELIAQVPHVRYVEPFVGMGGVFFRRRAKPKMEVINDINRDVVNLFRLLQRHYQQLLDTLKWQLCSRAEFDRLLKVDPDTLTDLERAARFLFLQRSSFGGKVVKQGFGVDYMAGARFNMTKLVPILEDVHERLAGVVIERMPYADCIRKYDAKPDTLFYLDPPYWGCTDPTGVVPMTMAAIFSRPRISRGSRSCSVPSRAPSYCRSTMCPRSARSSVGTIAPRLTCITAWAADSAPPAR